MTIDNNSLHLNDNPHVDSPAEKVFSTAGGSTDGARAKLSDLAPELGEMQRGSRLLDHFRQGGAFSLGAIGDRATNASRWVKDNSVRGGRQVTDYARANPRTMTAVGIGLVAIGAYLQRARLMSLFNRVSDSKLGRTVAESGIAKRVTSMGDGASRDSNSSSTASTEENAPKKRKSKSTRTARSRQNGQGDRSENIGIS